MKTNFKLIRLVLASSVGSVLWAGCAGPQMAGTSHFDPSMVSAAPVDHIERRPDTHPEMRSGLWEYGYQSNQRSTPKIRVLETTVVKSAEPTGADSTHLLVFNPEVLNVAATPGFEAAPTVVTTGPEGTIVEAAGAEPARSTGISSAQERWAGGTITTAIEPTTP